MKWYFVRQNGTYFLILSPETDKISLKCKAYYLSVLSFAVGQVGLSEPYSFENSYTYLKFFIYVGRWIRSDELRIRVFRNFLIVD